MLRELKCDTFAPTTAWDDVPATLCGELSAVPQGLYVFLFSNDSDVDVYDNNKKRKIVVHRRGASIKPGKFEQGLAVRVHNYNAHLHRTRPGSPPEWVLRDCFKSGYVLDLAEAVGSVRSPARIFERYWTEAVNSFLDAHRLLARHPIVQLGRAEWRYLERDRWTTNVGDAFREYLGRVSERIFQMVNVGALPAP